MATTTKKIEPSVVQRNPNAFMGLSSGLLTALVLYEIQYRLGVNLHEIEATAVVAFVTGVTLFLGKRIPGGDPA